MPSDLRASGRSATGPAPAVDIVAHLAGVIASLRGGTATPLDPGCRRDVAAVIGAGRAAGLLGPRPCRPRARRDMADVADRAEPG